MDYCHFQQLQLTEEFMSSVLLIRRLYSSVMNYRNSYQENRELKFII